MRRVQEQPPNVLLTTTYKPSKVMYHFLADLLEVRSALQAAVWASSSSPAAW